MIRIAMGMSVLMASLVAGAGAKAQVAYVVYTPIDASYFAQPVAAAWIAPAPAVAPAAAVTRWRYRPVIGGTVTRVRTIDYAAPPWWAPAW